MSYLLRRASGAALSACFALAGAAGGQDVPPSDRQIQLRFVETYRVGGANAVDELAFGSVRRLAFDAQGELYVMDETARRVVVVDTAGRPRRTLGRQGGGPGEWRRAVTMTVTPDGGVVVADAGHRAYLVYGADGRFRRQVPIHPGTFGPNDAILAMPDGSRVIWVHRLPSATRLALSGGAAAAAPPAHVVLEALDGREPTTIAVQERAGAGPARIFEPEFRVAVLRNGVIAIVDSTTYDVRLLDASGRLVARIRRPLPPAPVTPAVREAEIARQKRRIQERNLGQFGTVVSPDGAGGVGSSVSGSALETAAMRQVESRGFFPEVPVIQSLAADGRNRLWIERTGTTDARGPIDVFTADGAYFGTLAPGAGPIPAAFGPDDLVAVLEQDEYEAPVIRVGRLVLHGAGERLPPVPR